MIILAKIMSLQGHGICFLTVIIQLMIMAYSWRKFGPSKTHAWIVVITFILGSILIGIAK